MQFINKSIAFIITVTIVAAMTLLIGGLGILLNNISTNRWVNQLHHDSKAISDQLAASLALPLWNFDYAQIDKIIESSMQNRAIFSVVVVPSNANERPYGKGRDQNWRIVTIDSPTPKEGMIIQERPLHFANEKIGTVTVSTTTKFLDEFLKKNRLLIAAILFPLLVFMVLLLYSVMKLLIVNPLREVEHFASEVSDGNEFRFSPHRRRFYGELETVRHSLEKMVSTLQDRNAELVKEVDLRHASEERFRMLFERNPAPILIYEQVTLCILAANDAFVDFFGYSQEEIPTLELGAFFADVEKERLNALADQIFQKTRENEWITLRKDGTQIAIIARSSSITYQEKDARIVTITDISARRQLENELHRQTSLLEEELGERQKAQEALLFKTSQLEREIEERHRLEESERKLLSAVEQSPVSIMITDIDGRIEFINPKFIQVTGYDKEEVLGQNPRILKSGHTSPEEYRRLWATISAGDVWEGEFQNKRKNGELFWEQATIAPIKSAEKAITNYLAIKEDITARRMLEEQFRQSQKMESIGRLAGGVAHDFNNMLSVIMGAAELAKNTVSQDDQVFVFLQQILKAAERSGTITRQLLAFSRKEVINPKPVNLNAQVIESEKMLRRLIGEDVTFTFKPTTGLWPVLIDPSQMDQILMNLFVNARDAMPEGGTIIVETANLTISSDYSNFHADALAGDYVQLTVSDTGCGIDKETIKHIFEPFFTTKKSGEGTGLGLATVYGIVTQNKGFLNCYSEPGLGTTFKIYLPRLHEEIEAAENNDNTSVAGSGTILLVEDEELLLATTTQLLENIGYTVIKAPSPEEAIYICEKMDGIDLVLTDVIMPGMNGREMIEVIKKVRPEVKVLFISGYSAEILAKHGVVELGLNYISKPLNAKQLNEKIQLVLRS